MRSHRATRIAVLTAVKPITYSLQFRGQVARSGAGLRKQASAPGCALVTSLTAEGPTGRFLWAPGDEEALLESTLEFSDDHRFDEAGVVRFSLGHTLQIRGRGRLAASADDDLRQGTIVWTITGGEGHFEGATGLITSNFLLSATGDLTENQLAVVFMSHGGAPPPASVS
jgi:hypothetical protein